MELQEPEAGNHHGVWRRRAVRIARRLRYALHRGIPGRPVSSPAHHAEQNPSAGWNVTLGVNGFPLPATHTGWDSGLLQPKGPVLRPRPTQASVLRVAEVLCGKGETI